MAAVLPLLAGTAAAATHLALGALLAGVGAAKFGRLAHFTTTVAAYRLVPRAMVAPVALLIAGAELVAGLLLVTGFAVPLATVAGALLLLLFAAGMAINLARGRTELDCGCSLTGNGQPIDRRLVGRNIVMAAALLLSGTAVTPIDPMLWVSAGATAALILLLYHLFNLLVALPRRQRAKA